MSTKTEAETEIAQLVDRFMRRIHGRLHAAAPSFDHHRVGPGGGMLLLTIAELAPARMQDITAAMARDKSQMTRAVQVLERKGLVQRGPCADDARATRLTLTETGEACAQDLTRAVAEALDAVLAPLAAQEEAQLKALLQKL